MTAVRRTLPAAVLCCALGLLPAAASAAELGGDSALAPPLQELAKPSVRSLPPAEQAQRLGVAASGPGSLIREDGQILVETRFETSPAAQLPAVEAAGGEVVVSSQRYQQATVSVPVTDLRALAEVPGVAAVTPVRAPVLRAPNCQGGAVITEGIGQLNVDLARAKLSESEPSKEGEGLTIGVLSDSLAQAKPLAGGKVEPQLLEEEAAAKELPGPANSCPGQEGKINELQSYDPVLPNLPPTDEGRAMAQIIHDIVPRAKLAFNSAFNGELAFAEGIKNLAKSTAQGGAGADLIVDDVSYFAEPFFQDGPVAVAIGEAVAKGVTYLTSAGNDNLPKVPNPESEEISSWEAGAFRDSGNCPLAVRSLTSFNATHCLDFNPEAPLDRSFGIKVEPGATLTVDLQWAQPWGGVSTDLDAFLLDAEGRLLTVAAEDNAKVQRPVEVLQWRNESAAEKTVQLVVNRFSGGNPRLKFILLQNGGGVSATEYWHSGGGDVVGPAIYGHAGAEAAITVGAVHYKFSSAIERYSSRGPVTHYFGPVTGSGAAAALGEAKVISKPDVAATDCGRTTFFSFEPAKEPGVWRFCGTSAAAPHAAGIAALAIEAGATGPAEIAALLARTGRTVGPFGPCAAGGGLLNALAVVEAVGGTTTPPSLCGPPVATDPVAIAPGNWGLEQPPVTPVEPETPVVPPLEPETPELPPITPPTPTPTPTPPAQQPQPQPSDGTPEDPAKPPATVIRSHPRKLVYARGALARVVFRFAAEPAAAGYRCQFDGSRWRGCPAKTIRWFGLGPHVVRVQARAADGLRDPTPAQFRFRVARSR